MGSVTFDAGEGEYVFNNIDDEDDDVNDDIGCDVDGEVFLFGCIFLLRLATDAA